MSVDLMRLCWRVEFPSPAMSAVAVKLADCANDDGENVYPSVGRIERETRLGASTVRRVLAAFEEAGLLAVVAEASGNKWNRSTTIRRFNVGLLHALSAREVRRGKAIDYFRSTHVLKEQPEGNRTRWAIVERAAEDASDYDREDAPPLPQREGHPETSPPAAGGAHPSHPSHSGRGDNPPPLPQREGTPPAAGANPSKEEDSSPLTPRTAGGTGDLDPRRAAKQAEWLAELAEVADHQAVEVLFRPLLTTRHFAADKPMEALRDAAKAAKGIAKPALAKAFELVTAHGRDRVRADDLAEALAKVRKHGAMVVIRPGSAQWQRWLAHFEATDRRQAEVMRGQASWMVRAEWPPSSTAARATASGVAA